MTDRMCPTCESTRPDETLPPIPGRDPANVEHYHGEEWCCDKWHNASDAMLKAREGGAS